MGGGVDGGRRRRREIKLTSCVCVRQGQESHPIHVTCEKHILFVLFFKRKGKKVSWPISARTEQQWGNRPAGWLADDA